MHSLRLLTNLSLIIAISLPALTTLAAEKDKGITFLKGKIKMKAPKGWKKKKPRVRIIDFEYGVTKTKGDPRDARMTVMRAGGSVQANISRWIGQFRQTDGSSSRKKAKIKKYKVSGQQVHLVDLSGTYKDQRGPFAPAKFRKDYRMLSAIIETKDYGQFFVKLYGPKKTVKANEKKFRDMVGSLKVK